MTTNNPVSIKVEVIDLRTVAPYAAEAVLKSVIKTRRAVIVYEAVNSFGVGAEMTAHRNEELIGPLFAKAAQISHVPFAKSLETGFVPSKARMEAAVWATVSK